MAEEPKESEFRRLERKANEIFDRHLVQDPLLITNSDRPDTWRRAYLQRSVDKLPADVTIAFDKISKLQAEKDRLTAELAETKEKLKWANRKIWLMGLVVGPVFSQIMHKVLAVIFK